MSTLYRPVLIETAEQAEALPIGTVLLHLDSQGGVDQAGVMQRGYAEFSGVREEYPKGMAVGDLALVPIEAEEEWGLMDTDGTTYRAGSREHAQRWQQTIGTPLARRYVTPWEESR